MTYEESKPIARELAEKELKKHFDVEAFLVLSMLEMCGYDTTKIDLVPESNIDEGIKSMQDYFIAYMENRTKGNLKKMLIQTEQILTELYHSLSEPDEIDSFRKFLTRLQKIDV